MAKDRRIDRHAPGYMEEYKRETYAQVNVRIRKDAGILEALELLVCRKRNISVMRSSISSSLTDICRKNSRNFFYCVCYATPCIHRA